MIEALAVDALHTDKPIATLVAGPILEIVYEEMPDDDKLEFPELQEEMKKGRTRKRLADRESYDA